MKIVLSCYTGKTPILGESTIIQCYIEIYDYEFNQWWIVVHYGVDILLILFTPWINKVLVQWNLLYTRFLYPRFLISMVKSTVIVSCSLLIHTVVSRSNCTTVVQFDLLAMYYRTKYNWNAYQMSFWHSKFTSIINN